VKPPGGRIARAGIDVGDDYVLIAPVFIPDLADVRAFAQELHVQKQPWRGVGFGWEANYEPASQDVPEDSKATFTPASFCIGDALAWCVCLSWDDGDDKPPVETVTHAIIDSGSAKHARSPLEKSLETDHETV
jgi:hypothetical protein